MDVYTECMVDRRAPAPLAAQVAEELRAGIAGGRLPPHLKLAAEAELAAEFGVARGTLRAAVTTLVDEGLLVRVHGRGTFVADREPGRDLPLAQRLVTMSEVLRATGEEFGVDVLARDIGAGSARARTMLGLPTGPELFHVRRLLRVRDRPYVLLDNTVPLDLCPALVDVDFTRESLFDGLESRGGLHIAWGRRTFAATTDPGTTHTLDVPEGTPLLHIEQVTYLADEQAVEYSDVWVDGSRLTLTTLLQR